jgi:hypothetical protein
MPRCLPRQLTYPQMSYLRLNSFRNIIVSETLSGFSKMKKKSNLAPAHQIVANISLMPPIIFDASNLRPLAQSLKNPQVLTEEHSSSAVLLGGRYYPREAFFRTSFTSHSLFATTVHALERKM